MDCTGIGIRSFPGGDLKKQVLKRSGPHAEVVTIVILLGSKNSLCLPASQNMMRSQQESSKASDQSPSLETHLQRSGSQRSGSAA